MSAVAAYCRASEHRLQTGALVTLRPAPRVFAQVLPDDTTYTIAVNEFINAGGDGYVMFADGRGDTGEVIADAVMAYIQSLGIITPTIEGQITNLAP